MEPHENPNTIEELLAHMANWPKDAQFPWSRNAANTFETIIAAATNLGLGWLIDNCPDLELRRTPFGNPRYYVVAWGDDSSAWFEAPTLFLAVHNALVMHRNLKEAGQEVRAPEIPDRVFVHIDGPTPDGLGPDGQRGHFFAQQGIVMQPDGKWHSVVLRGSSKQEVMDKWVKYAKEGKK